MKLKSNTNKENPKSLQFRGTSAFSLQFVSCLVHSTLLHHTPKSDFKIETVHPKTYARALPSPTSETLTTTAAA